MLEVPGKLVETLQAHDKILVTSHERPDGDAVGSSVALAWMLRQMGKNVLLYNASGFPEFYNWLKRPVPLMTSVSALPAPPELVVALDCGDAARLGEDIQDLLRNTPSVNIDHHLGNPKFGSLFNWVDPTSAATGELVARLGLAMKIPLIGPIAEALYMAIITDTGAFAYGNTSPMTLRLCADMMENGLDSTTIRDRISSNWTQSKLRMWGEMCQTAQLLEGGQAAVCIVTNEMLARYGASREDTEGFAEQMRNIQGVRVSMLVTEMPEGSRMKSKISLRSSGRDDVRQVALQFGGGGHRNAAGAGLPLPPEKAFIQVMPYIIHVWAKGEYAKTPCPSAEGDKH